MRTFALFAASMLATAACAQTPAAPSVAAPTLPPLPAAAIVSHPDWPAAKLEDVATPDAIIKALSESISGPAGQPRDWNRFRSLFVPGAGRLAVVREARPEDPVNKNTDVIVLTLEEFIARNIAVSQSAGFLEEPLISRGVNFGDMVHIYSSYQIRHSKDDPKPIARGINSYEMLRSNNRYYILEVYWSAEHPGNPLPPSFLPAPTSTP